MKKYHKLKKQQPQIVLGNKLVYINKQMLTSLDIKDTQNKFIRISGDYPTTYWRH